MGEIHNIKEGRAIKNRNMSDAERGIFYRKVGLAELIITRDKLVNEGGSEDRVDFLNNRIDKGLIDLTEEERAEIDLMVEELSKFRDQNEEITATTHDEREE